MRKSSDNFGLNERMVLIVVFAFLLLFTLIVLLGDGMKLSPMEKMLENDFFSKTESVAKDVEGAGVKSSDGQAKSSTSGDRGQFICDVRNYFPIEQYPEYAGCFADADGNGVVNSGDRGVISANIGQTTNELICEFDLDGNGVINPGDRGIVSANLDVCTDLPDYQDGSGLNGGVPDTRFDLGEPIEECGDGQVQTPNSNGVNEECDGNNLNGQSCLTISGGFGGGSLACDLNCGFDTGGCTISLCGNNNLDAGEYCDDGNNNDFDGCSASCGREIYVDKENRFGNGCNNNWVGTQAQPKCNINQNWFMRNLTTGDSVIIRQATSYPEMRFYVESSGSAEKPISVKPWSGERIIIDGNIIPGSYGVRFLDGASHIHITGPIEISNHGYSIYTEGVGSSNDIEIDNCYIHNTGHGPRFENADGVTIRNCEVFDLSVNGIQLRNSRNVLLEDINIHNVDDSHPPDTSDADGFHSYGGENIVCRRCSSWGNSEDGFDFNANVEIIDSSAYDNKGAGLKAWRRVEDNWADKTITVENSRFYDNGYYALDPSQGNPGIKVSMGAGLKVYNSVVYGNYDQGIKVRWNNDDTPYNLSLNYQPVEIYNTIIGGTMNGPGLLEDNYPLGQLTTANSNLYFDNFGSDVSGLSNGQNDVLANPLFVNLMSRDFRLGMGSPAIDAGIFIFDVHCSSGQTSECISWSGSAPDIGFSESNY